MDSKKRQFKETLYSDLCVQKHIAFLEILIEKTGNRLGGKIGYVEWPEIYNLEIDSPLDFKFVEQIYNDLNS